MDTLPSSPATDIDISMAVCSIFDPSACVMSGMSCTSVTQQSICVLVEPAGVTLTRSPVGTWLTCSSPPARTQAPSAAPKACSHEASSPSMPLYSAARTVQPVAVLTRSDRVQPTACPSCIIAPQSHSIACSPCSSLHSPSPRALAQGMPSAWRVASTSPVAAHFSSPSANEPLATTLPAGWRRHTSESSPSALCTSSEMPSTVRSWPSSSV